MSITITFGKKAPQGLSSALLRRLRDELSSQGFTCQYMDLVEMSGFDSRIVEPASILIVRDGVSCLGGDTKTLLNEQKYQKKLYPQQPKIVDIGQSEQIALLNRGLVELLGRSAENLEVDTDFSAETVNFHGDDDRNIVIGVRLGKSRPLQFQWYQNDSAIGLPMEIYPELQQGDLYILSEKASGHDWQDPSIPTLCHAVPRIKTSRKREPSGPAALGRRLRQMGKVSDCRRRC